MWKYAIGAVILWFATATLLPSEALARGYGGGGGSRGGGGRSFGSSRSFSRSSTTSRPRFDESARRAVGRETSRRSFGQHPGGAPRVSRQQMGTRDQREGAFTASRTPTGYYTPRPGPTVIYNDPFSSSMLQYMSMMWMFNHWGQIDRSRFDEGRLRDLERQVAEMKAKGLQPDPNYVEPGVDADLIYRKDVVEEESNLGGWLLGFLILCGAGCGVLFVIVRRSKREKGGIAPDSPREEDDLYNPLRLHIGDFVSFQTVDLSGGNWSVVEVAEYQRVAGDETFPMANYGLREGNRRLVLRAVPGQEEVSAPDLLVLKVFEEMGFSQEVAEAVKSNEFYVDEDDGTRIVYQPLSDCGEEGWLARCRTVTDSRRTARSSEIRYWDYFRKGSMDRGEMAGDVFFFVEIDQETGWTRMLEGSRIPSGDVETFPAGRS